MSLVNYEEKLIEFGNDLKGLYMFNGAVQHFAWEQEGSMFKIVIFVRSEEKHEMEPIPLDEVIKMAEHLRRINAFEI